MPSTSLSRKNQYLYRHYYGYGDERTTCLPLIFQVPDLAPVSASMVPDELICYADIPKRKPSPPRDPSIRYGVHFYIDDYRFNAVLNDIQRAISILRPYSAVLTPDYSLYRDMDLTIQRINILRNRTVGYWMQEAGLTVIPTVSWSDERSYEFCFDGLPKNSVLSVSSVGILRDKEARPLFIGGYHAMIERLNPSCIMFYGKIPDWLDLKNVPVRRYENTTFARARNKGKEAA
ncbi:MAG: DUF4417 domain-containing protein [Thermoguttaceae bacterium]|nr:DUF4417 domain-containing protein [Thermoguttaceae bacterium]